MEKVLIADFSNGKDRVTARGLWQFDRGVKLKVIGINVADVNRVDFASVIASDSVPVVVVPDGDGTFTVSIPGAVTKSSYGVTAYIYVDTADYGYTVKAVNMPVTLRQETWKPGEEEKPDPFGEAVEKVSGYAKEARYFAKASAESEKAASESAAQAEKAKEASGESAEKAAESKEAAATSAMAAAESERQAMESAATAHSAADQAAKSATAAAESETAATQQATNATKSATNASGSAESANQSAQTAKTAADTAGKSASDAQQASRSAAESASTATAAAQTATTAAGKATESATSASQSAETAGQKATAAETAAGKAAESATAARESATAAGASATAAKESETAATASAVTATEQAEKIRTSAEQIEKNKTDVTSLKSDLVNYDKQNIEFFGVRTVTDIYISGSATKKNLMQVYLKGGCTYTITVQYKDVTTKNSYFFLLDESGNSILSNGGQTISAGTKSRTISAVVNNDYEKAYVALTCYESLIVDFVIVEKVENELDEIREVTKWDVPQAQDKIKYLEKTQENYFGIISSGRINIEKSVTEKNLLCVKLEKGNTYSICFTYASPSTKNSYVFLLDENGTSILSNGGQQILQGETTKTITYNALTDYEKAYVALSCYEPVVISDIVVTAKKIKAEVPFENRENIIKITKDCSNEEELKLARNLGCMLITGTITTSYGSKWRYDEFDCSPYDVFRITLTADTSPTVGDVLVKDADGNVIDYITATVSINELEYVIPKNGHKLYVSYVFDKPCTVVSYRFNQFYLPRYYTEDGYIQNKVDRIKTLAKNCCANGDLFFFITDIHETLNQLKSYALIQYISDNVNIPRLFNGGDLADGGSYTVANNLRKCFRGDIHTIIGNHEYMNGIKDSELYYMFDMYGSNQIGNPKRHYYYVDNAQQKIRYVCLCSNNESPTSSPNNPSVGPESEQVTWFKNVALDVGEGWSVIVFVHVLYVIDTSDNISVRGASKPIQDVIDAYNGNGEIICVIQGDAHKDRITRTPNGVPVIITSCDKNGGISDYEKQLLSYRVTGTTQEQLFDVVCLDKENRTLHFVRIGGQARDGIDNNVGDFVEERTVSY